MYVAFYFRASCINFPIGEYTRHGLDPDNTKLGALFDVGDTVNWLIDAYDDGLFIHYLPHKLRISKSPQQ